MLKTTRRGFLVGCSTAIAAMAGARINYAAFGSPEDEPNQEILVSIFLRGGCDALSLFVPYGGNDRGYYETARPDLKIPVSQLRQLGSEPFGLHPSAAALHELYQSGHLAIIPATGLTNGTRSHFDAQAYMDLGTPGEKTISTGWITRHMQTGSALPDSAILPVIAANNSSPQSLQSFEQTTALSSINNFNLNNSHWRYRDAQYERLKQLYDVTNSPLYLAGKQAMTAADIIDSQVSGDYYPSNGAAYPDNSFGDQLMLVAQMIKLQLGLRVATIDLGGWDTHENQSRGGDSAADGYFSDLIERLSNGLAAFYRDLSTAEGYTNRVTVVVMSEFGRRLRENDNRGTDHGHGGVMLALGGGIKGGLYGQWPGLSNDQLFDQADLAVTTDYRTVLSEILTSRLENNNVSTVFPGFTGYSPLGFTYAKGAEPPPSVYSNVFLPFVNR